MTSSEMFADLFDGVFGEKHLSFRCFFRSVIASVLFLVVTGLTLEGITRAEAPVFESLLVQLMQQGPAVGVIILSIVVFLLNGIPDYLSLYETRTILKWMGKSPSLGRILVILCSDILLTGAIFVVCFIPAMATNVAQGLSPVVSNSFFEIWFRAFTSMLEGDVEFGPYQAFNPPLWSLTHPFAVFFYTTFFTSIWVWLYGLSAIAVQLLGKTRSGLHFFQQHFDLDDKPLRAMGFVVVIFITVVYVIAAPFVLAG